MTARFCVALSLALAIGAGAGCPTVETDDDTAGDDDSTAGDDDTSTGDDDSTAGDDDTSAGDDDATDDDDATGDDDTVPQDQDNDGFDDSVDCDDGNPEIHPAAEELCNGIDDNCDGVADDGLTQEPYYPDADGDGYGDAAGTAVMRCKAPPGFVADATDCDDTTPLSFPDAREICDGRDGDCDGVFDDDCHGCDLTVPDDHATLQAAVDAALGDERICVRAGTYLETLDLLGKAVHLVGIDGPGATILDGGGAGPVVSMVNGEGRGTVIQGFTVTGGIADQGAGFLIDGADPTLAHLVVTGNAATAFPETGGGLEIDGGSPVLWNVTVSNNQAEDGAGMHLTMAGPRMRNVVLAGNATSGFPHEGGALSAWNVGFDAVGLAVIGNRAGQGAGMYLTQCSPSIANAVFAGNEASQEGGAIYTYSWSSKPTFVNVIVAGNSASAGGGIYRDDGTLDLLHVDLWGNTPDDSVNLPFTPGLYGNVSIDPELISTADPDPTLWDLHLSVNSPLIDAGSPWMVDPDGGPSDPGIYGGPTAPHWDRDADGAPEWWQPGPYDPSTYPALGLDCEDLDPDIGPPAGC